MRSKGVYTSSATWADSPDPKVQKFTSEFMKRKSGEKPNSGAFKAYDTVYIIKEIIEKNGVSNAPGDLAKDRDRLREGWKNLKDYPGISGVTSINAEGDGESTPTVSGGQGWPLGRSEVNTESYRTPGGLSNVQISFSS